MVRLWIAWYMDVQTDGSKVDRGRTRSGAVCWWYRATLYRALAL